MTGRFRSRGAAIVVLCLLLALLWRGPSTRVAAADIFTVNSTVDDGSTDTTRCAQGNGNTCRLRDAVAAANATTDATVAFDAALPSSITLVSPLTLSSAMTIQGNGTLSRGIAASSASNDVFDVTASGPVAFNGVPIASGNVGINITGTGGVTVTACSLFYNQVGLKNIDPGTVTVVGSSLSGNQVGLVNFSHNGMTVTGSVIAQNTNRSITNPAGAVGGGGIVNGFGPVTVTNSSLLQNFGSLEGGGIDNFASLTVTNSTLSGNSANSGGGIFNQGTLTVTNSTLAGNSASAFGGGIFNYEYGTVTVTNSTVSSNSATSGGGISTYDTTDTTGVTNTLIVDNTVGGDVFGPLATDSHNITGTFAFADADPSQPQDHTGPTKTLALRAGSPAIGAGDPAVCAATGTAAVGGMDQRGTARPTTVCDIGAYETPNKTLTLVAPDPGPTGAVAIAVTATDTFGGIMPGYRGTVHLTTTDPASTPVTAPFTAADAGTHLFPDPFATAGTWSVTATDGALSATRTVAVPLAVASVSPGSGDVRGGGTVTITGAHFGTNPAGVSVTFGTTAGVPVQVTKSSITVTAPAHAAGAVDVTVTVNGQHATIPNGYTYGAVNPLPAAQPASGSGSPVPLPSVRPSGNAAGTPSPLPLPRAYKPSQDPAATAL